MIATEIESLVEGLFMEEDLSEHVMIIYHAQTGNKIFQEYVLVTVGCCSIKRCWKLHQFVIVKYSNTPGPSTQFCNSSQWAFELDTLWTPLDSGH